MTTVRRRRGRTIAAIVGSAFAAAHLCFWLLPFIFESWNSRAVDQLFVLRTRVARFRPRYDNRVVHIDLNDRSLKALRTFYLNRSHFADVVRSLGTAGVAAQVFDFIFAAPSDPVQDAAFIEAITTAGNFYVGAALQTNQPVDPSRQDEGALPDREVLARMIWHPAWRGNGVQLAEGRTPLITYAEVASRAKGVGFINSTRDPDGVFRRASLMIKYADGVVPSLPLRVICDYLGVTPSDVTIDDGRSVTLRNVATQPGAPPHLAIRP